MRAFYVGLHQPSDARHFRRAFISVNRFLGPKARRADLGCADWIMDSGAFTELSTHGHYRFDVHVYATVINCWAGRGLTAAVAQDYMCEPFILAKTGLTVAEHQRLTIERYDALVLACPCVTIIPVLQGYEPREYVEHLHQYGARIKEGMWVGVGSICKRNGDPQAIFNVLRSIKRERPDLRLHGFGLKTTALSSPPVCALLETADSMSWSYHARRNGRNQNDRGEAMAFVAKIHERAKLDS